MNIIKSIIPFDLLVDTDMGFLKCIQLSYSENPGDLFYTSILEMIGPEHNSFLQYILTQRMFINPISVIVKPEKMLTCRPDEIYEKFMTEKKDTILKLSMNTAIMEMVCKSLFLQDSLRFDVLCKDKQEADVLMMRLEEHFKTPNIPVSIVVNTPDKIDINEYGSIYLKDIRNLKKYRHPIEGKNIIIANYPFNKDIDPLTGDIIEIPSLDNIGDDINNNEIKFIGVYSINESEIGVG